MGYFVDADGTVRSEESVRKEIEENVREASVDSYVPPDSKNDSQFVFYKNGYKKINIDSAAGKYKANIRGNDLDFPRCPICSAKIPIGEIREHITQHKKLEQKEKLEQQRAAKKQNEPVPKRKHVSRNHVSTKKHKILFFQRIFLKKYFTDKGEGFCAKISAINDEWQIWSGTRSMLRKQAWGSLRSFLTKRKQTLIIENQQIKIISDPKPHRLFTLEKLNHTEREKEPEKKRKSTGSYTATIADITGYDTHYANKGDWRFRDSNGQFGSTPLYDDYDN